jgi:hypothetical protein
MTSKSMKYLINAPVFLLLAFTILSCSKEPGTGGNSTIYGKVMVKDYNSTYTILNEEYYGQDVDVYLIYGDNRTYSDHVKTSYDGNFEFKYLRTGDYHVYCYSEDSTLQTKALIPVIRDVSITKNKQEVEVPEIDIFQ